MRIRPGVVTFVLLGLFSDGFTQSRTGKVTPTYGVDIGFSRAFVDPDIGLKLYGMTGELRWFFGRKNLGRLSKGLIQTHDLTLAFTKVLSGDIDATALGLSYGRRYQFPNWFLGFGVAPFSYWLLSNRKTDPSSGYILDTGPRLYVQFVAGRKFSVRDGLALTLGMNYNFTIKKVYWHNPLRPHKHDDIFHYLTLNVGFLK
jgi:hypothetical protein